MCTYLTEKIDVDGSGKGARGWFGASQATVYVDHPVHALPERAFPANPVRGFGPPTT